MRTYEDLQEVQGSNLLHNFVLDVIREHKSSSIYKEAKIAYEYYKKKNTTITEYQKLLYTLSGESVPDNYSANYKFCNAFFPIFIRQEASHLLGNGVTFNNESTKTKFGGNKFDIAIMRLAEAALWGSVSFGFYNLDHLNTFTILEFAPLIGEEDGALHAGVRFWQIDDTKPLRATLYEEDGYTDYIWHINERGETEEGHVLHPKRSYVQIIASTPADGDEILEGQNYPGFPIVPLWGNEEHQSEFTGLREKIDGYDLIQSGFANDLDDASQIYWIIKNAGGMDDVDLVKFLKQLKSVKAAVVDDYGSTAEPHTIDIPWQARMTALADIRDSLYRDAMALDTDKISAGNVTATAIAASYENLTLKCDAFQICVTNFINAILELAGIDDEPTYKRSKIVNMAEDTQMVLSAAQYLDNETILKHLPFLSPDEIEDILDRIEEEEAERYEQEAVGDGSGEEMDGQATTGDGEADLGDL